MVIYCTYTMCFCFQSNAEHYFSSIAAGTWRTCERVLQERRVLARLPFLHALLQVLAPLHGAQRTAPPLARIQGAVWWQRSHTRQHGLGEDVKAMSSLSNGLFCRINKMASTESFHVIIMLSELKECFTEL